jgi:hypothetical protein
MSSATDDLKDLFGSFTNLAQSAMQLHTVRVEAEANRRALEIGTARYNFLSRFNLPRDHPDFLSDDEGDWRGPLEELNRQTGEYLDSVKDPAVQRGVKSQLEGRNQQFMLELGGTLAQAGRKHAQEDYAVSMQAAIDIGDRAAAKKIWSSIVAKEIYSPTKEEELRQAWIEPMDVEDIVNNALAPTMQKIERKVEDGDTIVNGTVVDAGQTRIVEEEVLLPTSFSEAMYNVQHGDTRSSREKALAVNHLQKMQIAYNAEADAVMKSFTDKVASGEKFDTAGYMSYFMEKAWNMDQLQREKMANEYIKQTNEQGAEDVSVWTTEKLRMFGRGITHAAANELKADLRRTIVAKMGTSDERKWGDQILAEYEKSINEIDQWPRSGSDSDEKLLSSLDNGWLYYREAGRGAGGNGARDHSFHDMRNYLIALLAIHKDIPGIAAFVDARLKWVDENMQNAGNETDKMLDSMLSRTVGMDEFKSSVGAKATNALEKFISSKDATKWGDTERKVSSILVDSQYATEQWIKIHPKSNQTEIDNYFREDLKQRMQDGLWERALQQQKDTLFSDPVGGIGSYYGTMERMGISLAGTEAYGSLYEGVVKAVKGRLVDVLASKEMSSIGSGSNAKERADSMKLVKSALRPNDLFFWDSKKNFLYGVDVNSSGEIQLKRALRETGGIFDKKTEPLQYSGQMDPASWALWGGKRGESMWTMSETIDMVPLGSSWGTQIINEIPGF